MRTDSKSEQLKDPDGFLRNHGYAQISRVPASGDQRRFVYRTLFSELLTKTKAVRVIRGGNS